MKRFAIAAAAAAMLAMGTSPASADIHDASQCAGYARVALAEAPGGGLRFTGTIYGPLMTGNGGDHLTITSLTLTPVTPPGAAVSAGSATTTTLTTLTLSRDVPGAGAGQYRVNMTTNVTCRNGAWYGVNPSRAANYLYVPGVAPVKLSGNSG